MEWISVKERFPIKYGVYWVYRTSCNKMNTRVWNGSGWACDHKEITHWMHLPEPPKK